jgi:ferric-dicitrate binding protein FerR (iron transport regulator)
MVAADPGTLVVWGGRSIAPEGALEDLAGGDGALQVADGRLRLHYGDEFRMEVRPGSRVWLDPQGGRALRLGEGELFLQTFAAYGGQGLSVDTPETQVAVHGTTLGVRADAQGTCVCVLEGVVQVHEHGRPETRPVPACRSHLVFRDEDMAPKTMAFADMEDPSRPAEAAHVARLRAFHDEASF